MVLLRSTPTRVDENFNQEAFWSRRTVSREGLACDVHSESGLYIAPHMMKAEWRRKEFSRPRLVRARLRPEGPRWASLGVVRLPHLRSGAMAVLAWLCRTE